MSSSRREYHHHQEQQRRREQHATFSSSSSSSCGAGGGGANVNGHNKNAKWDSHLNNLLADLNTSVSDKQAMRSHGSPALDAGSSDCWGETRHFTCPDRDGTHVVQHNYRRIGTDALANQAFSQESHQSMFTRTEQTGGRSASSDPVRMKQNIQELDTILDELDQSKKRPGGSNFSLSRVDGAQSSTSTPYRSSSLRRHVDQTQDSSNSAPLASWTGNSRSPLRGLTAEVAPELQHAPDAGTTRVTRYEYRRCQRRQQSASPERRTPVPLPGSGRTRTEWHQAAVSTDAETEPDTAVIPRGLPSPPPAQPGTSTTINYHIYNYGRGVAGGDESRARSLSPVAAANANAAAADTTVSKSYVYHTTDHTQHHHHHHHNDQQQKTNVDDCRDGSPTRYGKFPTVPLNGTGTTGFQHSVTTVERSMTDGSPLLPRRSPSPAVRRPRNDGPARPLPPAPTHHVHNIDTPRHVEQLMAHIPDTPQDGTYPDGPRRRDVRDGNSGGRGGVQFTVSDDTARPAQKHVTLDSRSGDVVSSVTSRPGAAPSTGAGSVTGRSVYYPPGSNQFQSTSESKTMMESGQTRSGGKYKASSGYKASGRYKARAGSRETHAEGGATIPICLPLCCGGACNIM